MTGGWLGRGREEALTNGEDSRLRPPDTNRPFFSMLMISDDDQRWLWCAMRIVHQHSPHLWIPLKKIWTLSSSILTTSETDLLSNEMWDLLSVKEHQRNTHLLVLYPLARRLMFGLLLITERRLLPMAAGADRTVRAQKGHKRDQHRTDMEKA